MTVDPHGSVARDNEYEDQYKVVFGRRELLMAEPCLASLEAMRQRLPILLWRPATATRTDLRPTVRATREGER